MVTKTYNFEFVRSDSDSGASSPQAPVWNLESIFPDFEHESYTNATNRLSTLIELLRSHVDNRQAANLDFNAWLAKSLELLSETIGLNSTLASYAYCRFSVETSNPTGLRELNRLETISVPLQPAITSFREVLTLHADKVPQAAHSFPDHAWLLQEHLTLAHHQMSPDAEDLAADLARSGADAFTRLQEILSSSLSHEWNSQTGERRTMAELRGLSHSPDRATRHKAWELEIATWKEHEIAFATSLNGVKGAALSISRRRNWASPLDNSIAQSRISKKTLDSLISAMTDSLPDFQRFLQAKARLIGQPKLAFYDLFAPLEGLNQHYTFAQARDCIIDRFARFSPALADFTRMAFDQQWIDAKMRPGKVGGAYCTEFPLRGQTRIMSNFTGNFDSVVTIAHELGHAWHSWLLRDRDTLLRDYPMTLAETASLFCETLVYDAALSDTKGKERLALLEMRLTDLTQIIVDILSRFKFESAVFAKRNDAELGPDEFCQLMLSAQKETYGDALDPDQLHPYMWAVKGHYYHASLNFYNYPYAFGQLFGLGLFAMYQNDGAPFVSRYQRLLQKTGQMDAVELCKQEGIDIETTAFWVRALDGVRKDINAFCELASTITIVGKS